MDHRNRRLDIILALGIAAFILVPWYRIEGGFLGFGWFSGFPTEATVAPGILQIFSQGRWWLAFSTLR